MVLNFPLSCYQEPKIKDNSCKDPDLEFPMDFNVKCMDHNIASIYNLHAVIIIILSMIVAAIIQFKQSTSSNEQQLSLTKFNDYDSSAGVFMVTVEEQCKEQMKYTHKKTSCKVRIFGTFIITQYKYVFQRCLLKTGHSDKLIGVASLCKVLFSIFQYH